MSRRVRVRPPTVDELVDLVTARWDRFGPEKLRDTVSLVRDAVLLGAGRAAVRRLASDRFRQRRPHIRAPYPGDQVVLAKVAKAAGMEPSQLLAQDKSRSLTTWRFRAIWVLRRARGRSLAEVAAVVKRDFKSIVNAVRRVDAEVAADPALGAKLLRLGA